MDIRTESLRKKEDLDWSNFIDGQKRSNVYQSLGWCNAIYTSYKHEVHYLLARASIKEINVARKEESLDDGGVRKTINGNTLIGVLPIVHLHHWVFGSNLVSMPFCDSGGICTEDIQAEHMLLEACITLANEVKVGYIDLRQEVPLLCVSDNQFEAQEGYPVTLPSISSDWYLTMATHKVRLLLNLPESPERLMQSFKAKLRNQIQKPIKEGLSARIGGIELAKDFYSVFTTNMRDLGSPVHSRKLIESVLFEFPTSSNLIVIYGGRVPMAAGLIIGFRDKVVNPWTSSLRQYSRLAPNMLLYWTMLEWACNRGFSYFDFGRSTPGEGTYKFKEQWGARPEPLYWYRFSKSGNESWSSQPDKNKMSTAIEYWKKLPVPLTKIIGPKIRKYISL